MATVEKAVSALGDVPTNIKHKGLLRFVEETAALCTPEQIYFCNGSKEEYAEMVRLMLQAGTAIRLNDKLRPNCIFVRSDPGDVARVEDCTFICSAEKIQAGPTNHWENPVKMRETLTELFKGS